jgi:hypothetical protein
MYSDRFMLSGMKFRILDYTACLEHLNKSPFIRKISTNGTHRQMFRVQRPICICTVISLYGLTAEREEQRFKATMKCYGDFTAAIFN